MPAEIWIRNDDGLWCPSCGERIGEADGHDESGLVPESCRCCGYPDDAELMAQCHCGEESQ